MAGLYLHIPFCKKACHYCNFHFSTNQKHKQDLNAVLNQLQEHFIGELVINDISNDGVMQGFDLDLASFVHERIEVPFTFLGGAGSYTDLNKLIDRFTIIGAAAGSIFVFKGKYKAVLINYPGKEQKSRIINT